MAAKAVNKNNMAVYTVKRQQFTQCFHKCHNMEIQHDHPIWNEKVTLQEGWPLLGTVW